MLYSLQISNFRISPPQWVPSSSEVYTFSMASTCAKFGTYPWQEISRGCPSALPYPWSGRKWCLSCNDRKQHFKLGRQRSKLKGNICTKLFPFAKTIGDETKDKQRPLGARVANNQHFGYPPCGRSRNSPGTAKTSDSHGIGPALFA